MGYSQNTSHRLEFDNFIGNSGRKKLLFY